MIRSIGVALLVGAGLGLLGGLLGLGCLLLISGLARVLLRWVGLLLRCLSWV